MIRNRIILQNSLPKGDYNNFLINAKTLIKKALKKCVILSNFVYSKSPKTTQQKGYSNQGFCTQNCVKML